MKSLKSFLLQTVSAVLLVSAAMPVQACGPYPPIIPTPNFFSLSAPRGHSGFERTENLKLWQSLTSRDIPLEDIEEAVYRDSKEQFRRRVACSGAEKGNLFYTFLRNSGDGELIDFLLTAKELEERRDKMLSPWYYPRDRERTEETGDFDHIINVCRAYRGKRLADRYALQVVRALFASRRYAACVEYADSAFAHTADDNLMKRMARRYVAGCWSRLGDTERADAFFAEAGDIWSVSGSDPAGYMAARNPAAPQLMEYIRCNASDTVFMRRMASVAKGLLKDRRVKSKGDWHFLLAYVSNEYERKPAQARTHILRAMRQAFSSTEFRDLARAYKMKLDARTGNSQTLLADLKWMEGKAGLLNPDAYEWTRRCRNVIYADWVPQLWSRHDYAKAILLCAYADNLEPQRYDEWGYGHRRGWHSLSVTIDDRREGSGRTKGIDYGSLSFQMMGSLSSSQLAAAYRKIKGHSPLFAFLRRKACTDSDYYNELIGTLALREENYRRAERYLSRVSKDYLLEMNVNRCGYLSRDAFTSYPTRWYTDSYSGETWRYECAVANHSSTSAPYAKLEFARKMRAYGYAMRHGRTSDERGIARLAYAIGRRNSFEECWALTQYWRGEYIGLFSPILEYWDEDFAEAEYSFLYDYRKSGRPEATEALYKRECDAALAMLVGDEARAKAQYMLGNMKTVVKRYGNTAAARKIKTSCDNWRSWL